MKRDKISIVFLSLAVFFSLVQIQAESSVDGGDWEKNNSGNHYTKDCGVFKTFNYNATEGVLNGYTLAPGGAPDGYSYVAEKTVASAGSLNVSDETKEKIGTGGVKKLTLDGAASATAYIAANTSPVSFTISISGELTKSGTGTGSVTWSASASSKFFWLEPMEKIVSEGTSVTIEAKGAPTESTWSINNAVWNNHNVSNSAPYKTSSITLNRDMWDKMKWTPSPVPDDWKCPPAGIYNISATTTEKSPATSRTADATITVLGLKPLYYRIGNTGNFVSMEDYNDDGVYELIIPYHDQIISVGDELKGGAKNNIDVFIKATLQPSADVWPSGKPTWTGASIVSANDRSIAKLTVNNNGTSTVEVKYDDSYNVIAKIHVIKVSYEKDTSNKYGFDEPYANHPQNDYNTYISLKSNDSTSTKVKLDPLPSDLDFYAKTSASSKLKIGDNEEIKLNSSSTVISLNGQSSGSANVSVYVKHKIDSNKSLSLPNNLIAKIYNEKSWDLKQYSCGVSQNISKIILNDIFKHVVVNIGDIENGGTISSWDVNKNNKLDYYNGTDSNPEIDVVKNAISGIKINVVLVSDLRDNWRISSKISNTLLKMESVDSLSTGTYDIYNNNGSSNIGTFTITSINTTNKEVTISSPVTSSLTGATISSDLLAGIAIPNVDTLIQVNGIQLNKVVAHEISHLSRVADLT